MWLFLLLTLLLLLPQDYAEDGRFKPLAAARLSLDQLTLGVPGSVQVAHTHADTHTHRHRHRHTHTHATHATHTRHTRSKVTPEIPMPPDY